jgi:hypothetical protein
MITVYRLDAYLLSDVAAGRPGDTFRRVVHFLLRNSACEARFWASLSQFRYNFESRLRRPSHMRTLRSNVAATRSRFPFAAVISRRYEDDVRS